MLPTATEVRTGEPENRAILPSRFLLPAFSKTDSPESSMSENYWGKGAVELHYADCEHTRFIPRGHTADHQHCYGRNPELAKEPLPGCCEDCQRGLRALRAGQGGE